MSSKIFLFIIICTLGSLYTIFYSTTLDYSNHYHVIIKSEDICETIHVGLVSLANNPEIIDLYNQLKSIYFYRNNPLHFHILADRKSEVSLRSLFDTWNVPLSDVSVYKLSSLPKNLQWIVEEEISSDLPKLLFPLLLPNNVSNILVMDTNSFCVGDIKVLWSEQRNNSNQVQVLSNKRWNSHVLLFNSHHLNMSRAYKQLISDISNQNVDLINFEIESSNLKTSHKDIDYRIIRCSPFSEIKNNNDLSPTHNAILNVDVVLLSKVLTCPVSSIFTPVPKSTLKECANVPESIEQYFNYRTLLFVKAFQYKSSKEDVTMVTQMSFQKLSVFEIVCERWTGPISVVLYLDENELVQTLSFIDQSKRLNKRRNIAYHVVFKQGSYHPINKLRNIALQNVNTPYVLLNDVDFVPGPDVYATVKHHIKQMKTMKKKALVIPAFAAANETTILPVELEQMKKMWEKKEIDQFHKVNFPKGHGPTNYTKLKMVKKPYTIQWKPNYEPYVVVESTVLKYDERFVGYIWNKIQHILELYAAGYEFIVLPDTFLVHKFHPKSDDYNSYRKSKTYAPCMNALKKDFIGKVNVKYKQKLVMKDFRI